MPGKSVKLSLNLFSLAYFSLGVGSLSIIGTLPQIATSIGHGKEDIAFLVSVFSITFAVTAPLLQIAFGHLPPKRVLVAGLALMAAGAFGSALAPDYGLLFAARILAAVGGAAIGPVVSALGASLVPDEQRGHALAVVFGGMTIALVLGVPLSSWLGATIGWRATLGLIGIITLTVAVLVAFFAAAGSAGPRIRLAHLFEVMTRPTVATGIAVMVLQMAGICATYTMISPVLREQFGAGDNLVSILLMVYGVAGISGNVLARRIAMIWSADRAITTALIGLIVVFAALYLTPGWVLSAAAILCLWAVSNDIFMPSQQRRMVELAPEVRGLVLALNSSAIYAGIAAGSFTSGWLFPVTGLSGLPLASIAFLALSLGALWLSRRSARAQLSKPVTGFAVHQSRQEGPSGLCCAKGAASPEPVE